MALIVEASEGFYNHTYALARSFLLPHGVRLEDSKSSGYWEEMGKAISAGGMQRWDKVGEILKGVELIEGNYVSDREEGNKNNVHFSCLGIG